METTPRSGFSESHSLSPRRQISLRENVGSKSTDHRVDLHNSSSPGAPPRFHSMESPLYQIVGNRYPCQSSASRTPAYYWGIQLHSDQLPRSSYPHSPPRSQSSTDSSSHLLPPFHCGTLVPWLQRRQTTISRHDSSRLLQGFFSPSPTCGQHPHHPSPIPTFLSYYAQQRRSPTSHSLSPLTISPSLLH